MQWALRTTARIPVLSVSELNQRLRGALDAAFSSVWVAGELSNFRTPSSGHYYFSLKDPRSQIAAVMFRSAAQQLRFEPRDGLAVIARGRVSLYESRGDLQLYVDTLEPRGLGALQLALEQLKERLGAEGLFAEERKRRLPFWPRGIGIATALRGAAVHDILTTLEARMPQGRVVIRPVRVQGRGAGVEIAAAVRDLNAVDGVDVIILGRGGGSLEDLWAFNEEVVVRAVAGSRVPVVSAVGHELDYTLTDLVADCRAATPTAAATLVAPRRDELQSHVTRWAARLRQTMLRQLQQQRRVQQGMANRLRHPRQLLAARRLRVDELAERAQRASEHVVQLARGRLSGITARLDALSPLAVLQRGYAIARRCDDGRVVREVATLRQGDLLDVIVSGGAARVVVQGTRDEGGSDD